MAAAAPASAASSGSSWTAALAVLPARERLEWTRTINADVEAMAKAPPQPAFSRAYASAVHGSTGRRAALLERTSVGGHLAAVTRDFPGTDALVARMLSEAIDKAGVTPDVPFVAPPEDAARAAPVSLGPQVGGGAPADAGTPLDAGVLAAVEAAQLGAAYRPTIAKSMQRRLAVNPAWAAASAAGGEAAAAARFPHAAALARGDVVRAVTAAWEEAQELRAAILASEEGGAPGGGGAAAAAPAAGAGGAPGGAPADDLLDAALDELMG